MPVKRFEVLRSPFPTVLGGGVQQQKRSCRREKPKMSFVFFVLFQITFKIDVFVPNLVKNMSSKKNKRDHDFRIFDLLCSFLFFFVVFAGFG